MSARSVRIIGRARAPLLDLVVTKDSSDGLRTAGDTTPEDPGRRRGHLTSRPTRRT